jgi:hypothetical protein
MYAYMHEYCMKLQYTCNGGTRNVAHNRAINASQLRKKVIFGSLTSRACKKSKCDILEHMYSRFGEI